MAWPKGVSKPKTPGSGRQKGTLNRTTLVRPRIEQLLAEYVPPMGLGDGQTKGFDPIKEVLDIFVACKDTNPLVCTKIALELLEYIYPKKKAVEISGSLETTNKTASDEIILRILTRSFTAKQLIDAKESKQETPT